ncbi:MAG: hypothetical protein V2A79_03855, partial [Planctomycetota bacterium]
MTRSRCHRFVCSGFGVMVLAAGAGVPAAFAQSCATLPPDLTMVDCNGNGVPDICDTSCSATNPHTGNLCLVDFPPGDPLPTCGLSADVDADIIPDECDFQAGENPWNGFQPNPPFSSGRPVSQIDYDGDGIYWENPKGTCTISAPGCQTGDLFNDRTVKCTPSSTGNPEDGYVVSELFRTLGGELDCGGTIYSLSFSPKPQDVTSKRDWEFFIYDGRTDAKVVQLEFVSTRSARSGITKGRILVKNPVGSGWFNTAVVMTAGLCYDVQVVLDN